MNDQAINDAYQMFSQGGYNGSIDNFKQLIASNPNALNDSYEIFKSGGYSDDIESFKTLMGVSDPFSNSFIKKKSPGGVSISADGSSEYLNKDQIAFIDKMGVDPLIFELAAKQAAEDKEKAKQLQATGFRKEMKDAEAIELSGKEQPLSQIYDEYDDFFGTKNQQATGVQAFIESQDRPKGGNDYSKSVSFDPGLGIAANDTRYRVKDGFWERLVQGGSKYEKITNASSISALNNRYGKDLSTDVAPIEVKPSVIDPFLAVNSDFLSKTEEDAQTALEKMYGDYGFTFEQTGYGSDYIKVTPRNGAESKTFSFDEKSGDEAVKLQSFLRTNASAEKESFTSRLSSLMINMEDEGSADYLKYFKELTYFEKKEEIARREKEAAGFKYSEASGIWKLLGSEEDDKKVDIESKIALEKLYNSEEYKLFNSEKSKFEQQQEDRYSLLLDDYEIKQRNGDYEGARQAKLAIESGFSRDVIGDNIKNLSNSQYDLMSAKNNITAKAKKLAEQAVKGLITQEQFDIGAEAIIVEEKKLAISAESVVSNQKKMDALAGLYMLEKAKYGNFGSNLWNGFVIGANEVGNLLTSPSMDPKKGLGEAAKGRKSRIITPQQQKYYDDKGYSEEEVKNILYNKAEKDAVAKNKKAVIERIGFDLTTEESKSQLSFVENALVGAAASLPSMALRLVPGAGQALAFAGMANMSYNAIEEEMLNDPDFETTTKGERALVAVPYAAVMGYLENLGISKMTKGQSAILGKYILGTIAKAIPKKLGREAVENIVNKEVKSLVGKGVLKVFAGGLAEGETGAMQTLVADIGIKKAYNGLRAAYTGEDLTELTGGEAFGTPQSFSEGAVAVGEGALAEAIGGWAMSTAMVGFQGLATRKISLYNEDDLKFFKDFSSDEEFKKIIVTKLKTKMLEGTMTKSEAQAALNDIDLVAGVFNSIDENLPQQAKLEAFNLINEKRILEKAIEGKDPALSKKANERIAEINTTLEELPSRVQEDNLSDRLSDIEYALGRGRGASKTVRLDGKRISREEAETELQIVKTKIEENAIQKQAASEVLVQPTTTIGEEVVQGEPTAEPQVITEEGQAQEQKYLTAEETLNFSINNAKENIENRILRFQKSEDPSSEDWVKMEKEELNQLNENPLAYFESKLQQEITSKTPIPERIEFFEMIINEFKAVENAQAAPTQELAPVTQELVSEEVIPQEENLTVGEKLLSIEAEKAKGKAPRATRVRKAPVVTAPALEVEAAPIVVEPTQETVVAPVAEATPIETQKEEGEFVVQGTFNGDKVVAGNKSYKIDDQRQIGQAGETKIVETVKNGKKIFTLVSPNTDNSGRMGYLGVSIVLPENTKSTADDLKSILEEKQKDVLARIEKTKKGPFDLSSNMEDLDLNYKPIVAPVATAPVKEGAPTAFSWPKIKEYTSEVIRSMRQVQFAKLNPLLELKKPSLAQIIEIKALQAKIKSADAVLNARENKIKEDEKKAEKGEPTDKSPRVSGVDQNGKPAEFSIVVNEKKQTAKVQLKKRGDSELARQKVESDLKIQTDNKGRKFVETQNKSRVYIDEKVTPPKAEVKAPATKAKAKVKAAPVKEEIKVKKEFIIDGKEYTEEEAIEIGQNNFRYPNYGSKMEYNGSNPQAKEFVNDYNRNSSPYFRDGRLKGGYMKEKLSEALGSMSFRKFGNLYRKHIDPYFSRANNEKSIGGVVDNNFRFEDLATYIIGDSNPDTFEEVDFRAFAKEAGIEIPAAPVTEVKAEPVVEPKAEPVKKPTETVKAEPVVLDFNVNSTTKKGMEGIVNNDNSLKMPDEGQALSKLRKYGKTKHYIDDGVLGVIIEGMDMYGRGGGRTIVNVKVPNGFNETIFEELVKGIYYPASTTVAETERVLGEIKDAIQKSIVATTAAQTTTETTKKSTVTAEVTMDVINSIKEDIEKTTNEIKETRAKARKSVNEIEAKILDTKNENQKEELQFDIEEIETQLEEDLEGLKEDLDRQVGMLKEEVDKFQELDAKSPENKKTLLDYLYKAKESLRKLDRLTYAKLDLGISVKTAKIIVDGLIKLVEGGVTVKAAIKQMAAKYKAEGATIDNINKYLDSTYVEKQTKQESLEKERDKFVEIREAVRQARVALRSESKELRAKAAATIKTMLKGKVKNVSAVQMKSIMTRLASFNVFNQTQYDNFLEYVDKVIEITNYDTKVREANAKRKNAKNNTIGNNPKLGDLSLDLLGSLSRMLNINPKLISKEVFDSYYNIVDDLSKRTTILSPGERADLNEKVNEIIESIEQNEEMLPDLKDAYDNYADKVVENGVVNYAKTLTKMLEDGVINNNEFTLMKKYKSKIVDAKVKVKMTEQEIADEKAELINEITNTPITLDAIVGDEFRLERELVKRLAKLLNKESLENLDNKQLKDLIKILDNINNGFVSRSTQQMVEKLNSNKNAPLLEKSIPKSVRGIFKRISQRIRDTTTRDKYGVNVTPLFNIDEQFGDFKNKNIFNSVFEQSAVSQQQYQSEVSEVQGKLVKAESAIASSFDRNGNKIVLSKFKMMVYMMQLEFESNPNSQTGDKKQVNQAMKTLDATIDFAETNKKKSRYTKEDIKQMKAIKEEFEKDGEIDIDKLYNSFNKAEKNALKVFDEVNSLMTKKATYTATVINGNKIAPLKNYIYYNTISDPSTSAEQATNLINNINNNMKPGTESKNLQERTGNVSPVNLDPFFAVNSSAKSVLINYHMTEPIRTARKTLLNARKILENNKKEKIDVGEQFDIISVIEEAYETATKDLLETNFAQSSATLEYLTKAGYRAMLGSVTRSTAELVSNAAFVSINNPKDMAAGFKYRGIAHSGRGKNILTNLKSKVTSRNYPQGGLSSNYVDLSSFTDRTTRNGNTMSKTVNGVKQVYDYTAGTWVNLVETVADNLISRPDQIVMKQLYFGTFSREFKKETGIEPDFDKIEANDEEYMDRYKDALEKATDKADNQTVTAGSSMNAYMGSLQNIVRKDDNTAKKIFKTFNQFMNRFTIQEYITARRGVNALIGRGGMTEAEGGQVLAAVSARMTLYLTLGKVFSEALMYLGGVAFGYGDDDEDEDEKTYLQILYQSAVSSATTLFFGRNFGNAVRSFENVAIEQLNKEYGEDIGLRNGEYDPFKDAVQYNQFSKADELTDVIGIMAGPLGPVINAGTLGMKLLTKEAPTEDRAIETRRKEWYRLGLEAAGSVGLVPFYRDVRKVQMEWVYDELKTELKEDAAKKEITEAEDASTLETKTNTLNRMKSIYKDEASRSIIDYELKKLSDPDFRKEENKKEDDEKTRLANKYGYESMTEFEYDDKEKYDKVFGDDSPYRKRMAPIAKIRQELEGRMKAAKFGKPYKPTEKTEKEKQPVDAFESNAFESNAFESNAFESNAFETNAFGKKRRRN